MITDAVGVLIEGTLRRLNVSIRIALRSERSTKLLESRVHQVYMYMSE